MHTIKLEQEERGIGLQVEEVLGGADDPGQPPLVHLQQSVGRDGVSVMPDEADALAALLSRLAGQARDPGGHPAWCENRAEGQPEYHDHRGRVFHYDADAYAFTAAIEAWDDGDGELSDLHSALSLTSYEMTDPPFYFRIALDEARQLLDLLTRVVVEAEREQRCAQRETTAAPSRKAGG